MIYLLIALQFASHTAQTIEASPLCDNAPNADYHLSDDLFCVPTDLIFKSGFEL